MGTHGRPPPIVGVARHKHPLPPLHRLGLPPPPYPMPFGRGSTLLATLRAGHHRRLLAPSVPRFTPVAILPPALNPMPRPALPPTARPRP